MSSDSREQRERLKEEYKEHYRKMREAKEQLGRTRRTKSITDALRNMDTSQVMDSFDDMLFSVKSRIASVEARLEVAMDSLSENDETELADLDEKLKKEKARESLRQVKLEMGKLYNEIEAQADAMRVDKTIGTGKTEPGEQKEGER